MTLETLKDVKEIGGFEIGDCDKGEDRPSNYIHIVHSSNAIAFKLQKGPIGSEDAKEQSVNGCQVDTIIEATKLIIEGLNKKFPCRENSIVITKLDEALHWLEHRRKDRIRRGVEGTNNI